MRTLEQQQRGVLALIKERPANLDGDPWLQSLVSSREIGMAREIALWWRRFQIESQCRYTSRLMKRLGCFEFEVANYFQSNPTSPYIEQLAPAFLKLMQDHTDLLLSCVAKFELACIELRGGKLSDRHIVWDRDPNLTMSALDAFTSLPARELHVQYFMEISAAIPGYIACVREERLE